MSGDVSFGQVKVSNSLIEISFVPGEVLSGLDKAHSGFNGARKTSDKPPLVFNGVTKMSWLTNPVSDGAGKIFHLTNLHFNGAGKFPNETSFVFNEVSNEEFWQAE